MLVASHSARGGLRAGLSALAGIMAAIVLWYGSLIAFGLLSVLVAAPALFFAVKAAGALYLAYLGAGMLWSAISGKPHNAATNKPKLGVPFRQGFLTNALNPKVALFYLAALPQFTGGLPNAPLIGLMLLSIHAAFGLIWLSFIAFAAARARAIALKSAFVRWLEGVVGVFFLCVAGKLALEQR